MMINTILRRSSVPSVASQPTRSPLVSHSKTKTLIGRAYEEHSIRCMQNQLAIRDLIHVGVRGGQDGGIDVKGWWDVGNQGPVRVLAQCKASKGELGTVREIEGLVGAYGARTPVVLGLFFAARGFTRASLSRAEKSPFPLILLGLDLPAESIPDQARHACRIDVCYPNPVATRLIRPFEFARVWSLPSDGLPAFHEWFFGRGTAKENC